MTHEVAAPVLLQHLSGIASALLLGAATRRVTGSAWAGLLPAGIVLLDPDVIFPEHAIMAESRAVLAASIGLYGPRARSTARAVVALAVAHRVALGVAVTIRSAGLLIIPVVVLALLLSQPQPFKRWRAPLAPAGVAAIVLLAHSTANATFGQRFGIAPRRAGNYTAASRSSLTASGSLLRREPLPCARRLPFRSGEAATTTCSSRRHRHLNCLAFGRDDGLVGEWAERALRAQFGDFLSTAWAYLRSYWVPSWRPARLKSGSELDPQPDFTCPRNAINVAVMQLDLAHFYDPSRHTAFIGAFSCSATSSS